jgi:hypothetical protein
MKKYLLPKEGTFYKANLHMHTNISDGKMTVEETKLEYQKRGYSIVAFTDHEIMLPHTDLTDDKFLAITSTEISTNKLRNVDFSFNKTYHLNIYSKEPLKSDFNTFDIKKVWLKDSLNYLTDKQKEINYDRVYDINIINDIIKKANEEGCLVSYNHPVWSLQDYSDYSELKGLWGVEWYNNACVRMGYPDSIKVVDDLLRKGERVYPLATDDAHSFGDCFGGFVMVKAEKLEYDTVFNALKNGDFYSSTKPEIYELSFEDGLINIKTSPVKTIMLSTDRRMSKRIDADDNMISEVTFDIKNYLSHIGDNVHEHQYVRLTIIDECGNYAHTRAYFIDELIG